MIRLRSYAQLVRLPNIFTALADICVGGLILGTGSALGSAAARLSCWTALLLASAALYAAGMVLNDYFDIEQDRRERPMRPLPSQQITLRTAWRLGIVLLLGGVCCATLAGFTVRPFVSAPLLVAVGLSALILLYDRWLKRTIAGPIAMGGCRLLNVLLGLSPDPACFSTWGLHLAAVVGLYVVGITVFARTEAHTSERTLLMGGALLMLVALVLALPLPTWFPPDTSSLVFPYLLVGLGFFVAAPLETAIARPTPTNVQSAVKRAILGLIILDATITTAVAGSSGLLILLLLIPAVGLARSLYTT